MTQAQKIAWGETVVLPADRQGQLSEVCRRADPAWRGRSSMTLIPGEPALSEQYYSARVRVSQSLPEQSRITSR